MTPKMGKVEQFILDLAVYEEEPLHILVSALIGKGLCASPDDIVEPLISLVELGMVDVWFHALYSRDQYLPVRELTKDALKTHIERNRAGGFSEYPAAGGEYFFQTSETGRALAQGWTTASGQASSEGEPKK